MIPYTVKVLANGAISDSVGNISDTYISVYNTGTKAYYLRDKKGTVDSYDFKTKELSTFTAQTPILGDVYSVVEKDDVIYAFSGFKAEPFDSNSVLYVKDNSQLVVERYDRTSTTVLISSQTEIRDFLIDTDLSYYVLYNTNKVAKFSKERILQYSLTVGSISSVGLSSADNIEVLNIDKVREYTSTGLQEYPIILGTSNYGAFLGRIDEAHHFISYAKLLSIAKTYTKFEAANKTNSNLTNFSFLRQKYTPRNNTLDFRLKLVNIYNNIDIQDITVPFDVSEFTAGYHHFAFRVDAVKGAVCLFVDGRLSTQVNIPAGQYIFQDISHESLCVGSTYFYNNIPLFKHLKQNSYYFINNCKMKQFKVYDTALSDTEIKFLTYCGIPVKDLVVSLPCGQRNALDSIERQFTLNTIGGKSNSINIVIKNSAISDTVTQDYIRNVISDRLSKVLPATTKIQNIAFQNADSTLT